jgi:carboxymethylenebutenolidase
MTAARIDTVSLPDGEMDLHVWLPASGTGPAVLLLHEIFGIADHMNTVAGRLAGAGYVVGIPDLFWRFAPGWVGGADEVGVGEAVEKVSQLDQERSVDDCGAGLDKLASLPEASEGAGVCGFCLGGTLAYGVAARFDPALCVSYYGSGVPDMLDLLDEVSCPTLFQFGSVDPYIAGESIDRLGEAIADRPHMALNVEIAGHAFDNEAPMFHNEAAARSAWSKTMAFLAEHLPLVDAA